MAEAFDSDQPGSRAADAGSGAGSGAGSVAGSVAGSGSTASTAAAAAESTASADAFRGACRVLVVGEPLGTALRPRIVECVPEATVRTVPSLLFAMGEAAQQPAEVVVACADALAGMAESASRSLRELLPASRLVVVANTLEAAQEAEAAVRGGFDLHLDEPISDDALRRALGRGDGARADGSAAHAAHAADGAATRAPAGAPVRPASPIAPHVHEASAPAPATLGLAAGDQAPTAEAEAPGEAEAPDDRDALGDVDLVEALLGARDQLEPMAVRLIAERSGIAGLNWRPDDPAAAESIPHQHVVAPVTHRGRRFGSLHAPPPASGEALAGWAGWLGRWLGLGEHLDRLETLAMTDELTGTWNRRYFNRFLLRILEQAQQDRSQVTLLVFDIDDFKCYNDRYGHAAGDEILRETAKLMRSFVREHDVVARIGGDEFAVIFWDAGQKRRPDSAHPQSVRQAAERFQKAICAHRFPKLLQEAPGTLTISGGLASYPWDGRTPDELLALADEMALQSKRQGKNAITFGPGAMRACNADGSPDEADA